MRTPPISAPSTTRGPLFTGGVLAVALAVVAPGPEPLVAAPSDPIDADQDGIPTLQEHVLGTSEFLADTDADGYGDAEELARGSDPLEASSVPEAVAAGDLRVGITARGERGNLRLHVALFSEAGDFNTSVLRVGALVQGQVISVPFERLLPSAELRDVAGAGGTALRTIDLELDPVLVHTFGSATFFIAVGEQGSTSYDSAAKVDVTSVDVTLLLRREPQMSSQQGGPVGGGSLRQPIPTNGAGGVPQTWLPGQICYQRSTVTGVAGAKVIHEVTSASCIPGWDSFCPSDCQATVGGTYETIDPTTLIGG